MQGEGETGEGEGIEEKISVQQRVRLIIRVENKAAMQKFGRFDILVTKWEGCPETIWSLWFHLNEFDFSEIKFILDKFL